MRSSYYNLLGGILGLFGVAQNSYNAAPPVVKDYAVKPYVAKEYTVTQYKVGTLAIDPYDNKPYKIVPYGTLKPKKTPVKKAEKVPVKKAKKHKKGKTTIY